MMSKLYVGNLPNDTTETNLRQLFHTNSGIVPTTIQVKRGGYAFIDCDDQNAQDRIIDKLNGTIFLYFA